jgi:hypothetical protein
MRLAKRLRPHIHVTSVELHRLGLGIIGLVLAATLPWLCTLLA